MIIKSDQSATPDSVQEAITKLAREIVANRVDNASPILKAARLVHDEGASVPDSLVQEDFLGELDAIAARVQDRNPAFSTTQALAVAWNTPDGQALYSAYTRCQKSLPQQVEKIAAPEVIVETEADYIAYLKSVGQWTESF